MKNSRSLFALLLFVTLWLAAGLPAHGASGAATTGDTAARSIRIHRLPAPPTLDDLAAGRVPEGMVGVTDFRQREPGDGTPASRPTEAYLGYDDQFLYAAFRCREDRGAVRAALTKREAIDKDDMVFVALDTFRDRRHAYLFMSNALGVQRDAYLADGQDDDYTFDAVWKSEARLTEEGFVAVIAVPFRSLRFRSGEQQTWGIAVGRSMPARSELVFWPAVTRSVPGMIGQLAALEGLEGLAPDRPFQVVPYMAGTGSRYLGPSAAYERLREGRAGVDAKVVVKNGLVIDATINPDFSQVESDEPQVTVNQRFEVLFPEKRPFFLENAALFATPERTFFSRRMVDPRLGIRLTGKLQGWSMAGFVADDRARGDQLPENDPLHGTNAVVGVARLQRDLGRNSMLGFFASRYLFGSSHNDVFSTDTRFQKGHVVFVGQATHTRSEDTAGREWTGNGYRAKLTYETRAAAMEGGYVHRDPGYRTRIGFVRRVDVRNAWGAASYFWYPRSTWLLRVGPVMRYERYWDAAGRPRDWVVRPAFQLELPASTRIELAHDANEETYRGLVYRWNTTTASVSSALRKWLAVETRVSGGNGLNYYPAEGTQPSVGGRLDVQVGVVLRPSPRFGLEQGIIYNRLRAARSDGDRTSREAYRLHLARTKITYQFSPRLSLRGIVDYQRLVADASLIQLEHEVGLAADVLMAYQLNPLTALHVGYSDRYANLRLPSAPGWPIERTDTATTSVGRQLFVKVSCLLPRQ